MLRDRAQSAALLVPPLLLVLWLGGPWIAAVVALAVAVAAREAFRLLEAAGHPSFATLGIVLAVVVALADTVAPITGGAGLLLASVGMIVVGSAALTRPDPREGLASFATTVFGALYAGLLGFVPRLGAEAPAIPDGAPLGFLGSERGWILLLLLSVWAFDTGAYAVGRRYGRRPFMAHISPSKTVEGVVGGAASATAVAGALVLGLGGTPLAGIGLGLVVAVSAQAGDLVESMLKRAAGVKDSGRLIPGHGGLLDRVDSFLFAAPAVLLYVHVVIR